ncbi:MAG: hypothetical protein JW837_00450 [Sedimentisphaerales bacterium]|nr:hypothetical protein [Sedimentisphaerales bacterium]
MDTAGMVGLMGLTFFCNKCVEVFYKFSKEEVDSPELKETCKRAVSAFKSLKWPREQDMPLDEKVALFNTNEEIESFQRVLESKSGQAEKMLNDLIKELNFVLEDTHPLAERKKKAKKLQEFFDNLGDYSFYATKDCLREEPTMMGV